MGASGSIKVGGVVSYTVSVNGKAIPGDVQVLSLHVHKEVNRISTATIVVIDGQPDEGTFPVSSSSTFLPGAIVLIEAGYDAVNKTIFQGIITRQSITIHGNIGSTLEIECRDAAVKMIVGRKNLTFSNKKDSDIISSIIGTYSGLTPNVTATATTWPEQVQYYTTDWDFMLTRAEANGLIVTTLNGKVSVVKPDADISSALTITYGDGTLREFNADLDSITQLGSAKASTWDYKSQAIASGEASNSVPGPGNLSSKKLSAVVGLSDFQLQTSAPMETADLTNWSKAQLIKSEYSKIRGTVTFAGTALVDPGKYLTINGVGDRFSGNHLISAVTHTIAEGDWAVEVGFGLSSNWFTEEPDIMAPPASGLLPGASGLFNGTVKKIADDPDSQYRILVNVPLFDANGAGIWARLSNFYSTNGAGAFFLPEVGDEVILGFLNEDPRFPVILGSVYSSSKLKPASDLIPNEKNSLKAIVTKSGIALKFDDENKVLTIVTPDKNTIVLSDKDKQISLKDDNGNSLLMSSDGITIKSPKNINIEADKNITLKGTMGIKVQAPSGDVNMSAMNIKETADVQYSAEGSTMAKVSGGTQLTLKGAMVMIN